MSGRGFYRRAPKAQVLRKREATGADPSLSLRMTGRSGGSENTRLKADLATARKAEEEVFDDKGAVERLEKDQQAVREHLEKLIASLEAADKS